MKFLKKLLNRIKSLFKKEVKVVEDSTIDIETQKLLSDIYIGDVIWANRYHNEEEKEKIPLGHREGPFIVVGKTEHSLICSGGTSSEPSNKGKYFMLKREKHLLSKDGYYRLCDLKIVTKNEFIRKLDILNHSELNEVFKGIKKNRTYKSDLFFGVPLQIGDIVSNENLYYLILDIKDKISVLPLNNRKVKSKDIKYIDYLNVESFNKDELEFVSVLDDKIVNYIVKKYKEYINYSNNKGIAQRGSVILRNNEYYYVYGEEGDNWLVFKISEDKASNLDELKINQKIYYTNYEDIKINKKEDFNVILLCKEEEIDKVKNRRKHYKESKKEKEEQERIGSLKVGAVISNVHYKKKRYIMIENHKKTIECLDIDKIKKGIYSPILIKKEDAIISKNTSIKGIKWLDLHQDFDLSKINDVLEEIFNTQQNFLNNEEIIEKIKEDVVIATEEINTSVVNIQRGNVVRIDDKLYYIYGEEGQDWLAFEVIKEFNGEYDELIINNFKYYTLYKDIIISKKQNFDVVSLCSEKEIDDIKAKRKSYKKTHNVKLEKKNVNIQVVNPSKIRVGIIVKNNELSDEEFVVKQIIGKVLCCISTVECNSIDRKTYYFNKDDVIVVDNKKRK